MKLALVLEEPERLSFVFGAHSMATFFERRKDHRWSQPEENLMPKGGCTEKVLSQPQRAG